MTSKDNSVAGASSWIPWNGVSTPVGVSIAVASGRKTSGAGP
ncbi:hypothetical protein [Streptomyces anulatus]|nr:hypothetical protein [Streptomyces anulatus]